MKIRMKITMLSGRVHHSEWIDEDNEIFEYMKLIATDQDNEARNGMRKLIANPTGNMEFKNAAGNWLLYPTKNIETIELEVEQ